MASRMPLDLKTLRALLDAPDTDSLSAGIQRLVAPLGVDYWFYALDLPVVKDQPSELRIGNYPESWVRHYFENEYIRIDPVISHCQDHAVPLIWQDAVDRTRRLLDPTAQRVRQMFGEASEFGLCAGLSIPLHGPGVSWGLMSYASRQLRSRQLQRLLPDLHVLAHYVHEAARRFLLDRPGPVDVPALTRRERECLTWAAEGKTSWEIGQMLKISERTTIFHLQNAIHKLGVSGRQAAVARAVSYGLIVSPRG